MDMQGLSSICAGLGIADEDERGNRIGYVKSEYCLDNLKDLLRFLRRDDPLTREVFKQICKWNIVSKDLIPIMEYCQDDRNLVLSAVKVLVFLTMPIEPSSNDIPQQIEHLWGLKSAITCSDTVAVIVSLLESPLENLECGAFSEDDWKLVQLILTLFRNILAVQDISSQQKVGGSAIQYISVRDRFLELLFRENVMDLILVLAQHVGGSCVYLRHDNFLLLETFHYIFMGQDPELIAKAHLNSPEVDGVTEASFDSLKLIIEEEEEKKRLIRLRNICRHSQFSGTFTRRTMDGSKAVFKGNPSASPEILLKHRNVQQRRVNKIATEKGLLPSMKNDILKLLHGFINHFLSGAYNVLMQSIRDDIEKELHAVQSSDIIVFFKVAQFVTSFQYHQILIAKSDMKRDTPGACNVYADSTHFEGDICGPIAASMNESMFSLVLSRWRNAFDGLKELKEYKLLSSAGSLMKNMIRMLDLVLKLSPDDSKEAYTARILLYKLFYDQTDQGMTHFLLNMIKSFDNHKQPKSDLAYLVEMINLIVHLMENLQQRGTLRVSKKSRKGRKKKLTSEIKETHDTLGEQVTGQNGIGISGGEQVVDMENPISKGYDGESDARVLLQVDEPEISILETGNHDGCLPQMGNRKLNLGADDLCTGNSESSGDEQDVPIGEVDFKVSSLISAFASNSIIQKLCWLLKFFKSNSASTNHDIICILQRITEDMELSPMLYQLSLLTTFYEILAEQRAHSCKEYEKIVQFLANLVRKMLKKMKSQPLLFVEVLFWKTRRECNYISAEYLLHEFKNLKKKTGDLDSFPDEIETGLAKENMWVRRSIADALGEDEADVVISHDLGHQEYPSEAQDGRASKLDIEINDNGSVSNKEDPVQLHSEKGSRRRRRVEFNDEVDVKIKELYEEFKDDWNCSRLIAQELDHNGKFSPAQVANRLKQFGLRVARKTANHNGEKKSAVDKECLPNETNVSGESIRQTRKRVRAFSDAEEQRIKALYEEFKHNRRCCYMIANALSADGKFTTAQVSRKLKQLGLHVSRQNKNKLSVELKEEDVNNSDDEILSSLRNRHKNKEGSKFFSEDSPEKRSEGIFSGEMSDDEILSSVLRKNKKRHKCNEELTANSDQKTIEKESIAAVIGRDGNLTKDMKAMDADDTVMMDRVGMDDEDNLEANGTEIVRQVLSDGSRTKIADDLPQGLEDDFADSDSVAPSVSPDTAVNRRKRRIVVDDD